MLLAVFRAEHCPKMTLYSPVCPEDGFASRLDLEKSRHSNWIVGTQI